MLSATHVSSAQDPEGDTASESEGEESDLEGEKDVVSSDGEAVGKPAMMTMSRKARTGWTLEALVPLPIGAAAPTV